MIGRVLLALAVPWVLAAIQRGPTTPSGLLDALAEGPAPDLSGLFPDLAESYRLWRARTGLDGDLDVIRALAWRIGQGATPTEAAMAEIPPRRID